MTTGVHERLSAMRKTQAANAEWVSSTCSERQRRRAARAFTLIELLVTISIISLLLAVLLPALSMARERTKMIKCLSNMRSISQFAASALTANGRFQLVSDEVGVQNADPDRSMYAYSGTELLAWPVAMARANGMANANWEWGVRAGSYAEAKAKKSKLNTKVPLDWALCPSDQVRIASAYYPRNKGGANNGLEGMGDPNDPRNNAGDSYWGFLSYGLNEDVAGAETSESRGFPACWRRIRGPAQDIGCRGEFAYPPSSPCAGTEGRRLQGNLDRVFLPSDVVLVLEAGRDDENSSDAGFANLVTSALATGPFLSDFQQFHQSRLPTARHPRGALNVLYADFHGGTTYPVKYNATNKLPSLYSPQVRVSPYRP